MLTQILKCALADVAGVNNEGEKRKYDDHLIRVTRDPQSLAPRVEATDLKRIIRIEALNCRTEQPELFVDATLLSKMPENAEISQDGKILAFETKDQKTLVEGYEKANWPDFDKVLPNKPAQSIELNGALLVALLETILAFEANERCVLTLELHRQDLVIRSIGKDLKIVAMQSRLVE
jgi:hypothetical protein